MLSQPQYDAKSTDAGLLGLGLIYLISLLTLSASAYGREYYNGEENGNECRRKKIKKTRQRGRSERKVKKSDPWRGKRRKARDGKIWNENEGRSEVRGER